MIHAQRTSAAPIIQRSVSLIAGSGVSCAPPLPSPLPPRALPLGQFLFRHRENLFHPAHKPLVFRSRLGSISHGVSPYAGVVASVTSESLLGQATAHKYLPRCRVTSPAAYWGGGSPGSRLVAPESQSKSRPIPSQASRAAGCHFRGEVGIGRRCCKSPWSRQDELGSSTVGRSGQWAAAKFP